MVTLGARPQGLEHHRDYLSIGFPLRLWHRLSIHVHRGLDRGMTHEFLLDLHRRSGLVQPRTIRVAERVPADGPVLAGVLSARLMQEHSNAVTGFLILVTPDTRRRPARRTCHHTATRGADMRFWISVG